LVWFVAMVYGLAYLTGCSTYGHDDGRGPGEIMRPPGEETPPTDPPWPESGPEQVCDPSLGYKWCSGKCDPATECCNPSSCNPACRDGYVCMTGKCINVLTLIK
jgi:hypothetical protein